MTDEEKIAVIDSLKKGDEVDITIRATCSEAALNMVMLWQRVTYLINDMLYKDNTDDLIEIRKVEK